MGSPEDAVVIRPERREDGTFRYPCQVVLQSVGKYATGHAVFELVGWASDLEHVKELRDCLV